MIRLDNNIKSDPVKFSAVCNAISKALTGKETIGELRLKQVSLPNLDKPVDIDISYTQKKDEITYTTDMCIKDRLETIKELYKDQYPYVLANMVYAKKVLKEAGCYYKHGHSKYTGKGGLGGVGIENWILQNGGSFIEASKSFLEDALNEQKTNFIPWESFKEKYSIWDFGENFKGADYNKHDEFVHSNMDKDGYEQMCITLKKVLENIKNKEELTEMVKVEVEETTIKKAL